MKTVKPARVNECLTLVATLPDTDLRRVELCVWTRGQYNAATGVSRKVYNAVRTLIQGRILRPHCS